MNRIAILDFVGKKVIVRSLEEGDVEENAVDIAMEFESTLGLHLNDCEYMVGDIEIDVEGGHKHYPELAKNINAWQERVDALTIHPEMGAAVSAIEAGNIIDEARTLLLRTSLSL